MQRLFGQVITYGFFFLAVAVIGWTAVHTYDVLYSTNPIPQNQFLAIYGLVVFEGGLVIWFGTFLKGSKGLGQHAVALLGTVISGVCVLTAFAFDYIVPHDQLVQYNSMARWAIIVATGANVLLIGLFELLNPAIWEELTDNIHVADLLAKADEKAKHLIEKDADELAHELALRRKERAYQRARMEGHAKSVPNFVPPPVSRPPVVSIPSHDGDEPKEIVRPPTIPPRQ